jgi:hypothetical protein
MLPVPATCSDTSNPMPGGPGPVLARCLRRQHLPSRRSRRRAPADHAEGPVRPWPSRAQAPPGRSLLGRPRTRTPVRRAYPRFFSRLKQDRRPGQEVGSARGLSPGEGGEPVPGLRARGAHHRHHRPAGELQARPGGTGWAGALDRRPGLPHLACCVKKVTATCYYLPGGRSPPQSRPRVTARVGPRVGRRTTAATARVSRWLRVPGNIR